MNNLGYTSAYNTDSGSGSDQSLTDLLTKSSDSAINELEVLVREHVQNSIDAFDKRKSKPEKLIFKISRKKINYEFARLNDLKKVFDECIQYKEHQIEKEYHDSNDALVKLKQAREGLSGRNDDNLWSIVIEDNGCGLTGNSRFHSDIKKTGTMLILDEGDSNKYKGEGGAFGVGKLTAFTNNDLYTVFYLNSFEGNNNMIGKTKLESFTNKSNKPCSPNTFFGNVSKQNPLELEASDWFTYNNSSNKIRTIDDDGLTTIIPFLKDPENSNDQWLLKVSYAIIHSYFNLFEKNEIQAEILDEYSDKSIVVTKKNYKELYINCEELEYLNNEDNVKDKYNYHLVSPFVLGEEKYKYNKFQEEYKVTNKYKGTAIFHVYQNPKLNELIEQLSNKDAWRTFRFIRKGMLLRSELLPGRKIFDPHFCGYVEFKREKGDYLNDILRAGETQSHDKIEKTRYQKITVKDFPKYSTINAKLFHPISKKIKKIVDELSSLTSSNGDEYDLEFDFLDGFNSDNLNPSFNRNIISSEHLESLKKKSESGRVSGGELGESVGFPNDKINYDDDKDGNEGFIIKSGVLGGEAIDKVEENDKDSAKRNKTKKGNKRGKREQMLESIFFMTKILSKEDRIHEYAIKLYDVKDEINIEISQDSYLKRPMLSFDIRRMEINGKEYFEYEPQKESGVTTGFKINSIPPVGDVILIKLVVTEPSMTESRFNLLLS